MNSVKKAVTSLFEEAAKSASAMKRLLNPSTGGSGQRVYPPKTAKNDEKYGIRIDKGETVQGSPDTLRLKLQLNSNAENKSIRELAKKDSHKVYATADVDVKQEVNKENLNKMRDTILENLKV